MKENSNIITSDKKRLVLRAEVEKELRSRAYKDEAFRLELLANPRAVLERDYPHWFPGGKIPEGLSIKVNEEEEQTWNLFLPPKSFHLASEVDEENLDAVTGGVELPGLSGLIKEGPRVVNDDTNRKCYTKIGCTSSDTCSCSRRMGL